MRDFPGCEKRVRKPQIVRKSSRSRFVIRNRDRVCVRVIDIDGCVITEGLRCDYLFIPIGDPAEIYVELKGSGVRHGIRQIEATIPQVSEDARKSPKHCYIVSNRVPKVQTDVQRAKVRFRRDYSAVLTVKNGVVKHKLVAKSKQKRGP